MLIATLSRMYHNYQLKTPVIMVINSENSSAPRNYCFLPGQATAGRNNNINLSGVMVWWLVVGVEEADGRVVVWCGVVVSLYDSKILIVVLYDCNQQTNDWSEPCKYPGSCEQ